MTHTIITDIKIELSHDDLTHDYRVTFNIVLDNGDITAEYDFCELMNDDTAEYETVPDEYGTFKLLLSTCESRAEAIDAYYEEES